MPSDHTTAALLGGLLAILVVLGGVAATGAVGPTDEGGETNATDVPRAAAGTVAGTVDSAQSADQEQTADSAQPADSARTEEHEQTADPAQTAASSGGDRRIDFLEVRSTGDGEYAYRIRVRGYVQKTRVNDFVKAEANDEIRENPDGTVTVIGTTGNERSDAYVFEGEVVSFRKTGGESGGDLFLNSLAVSVDDLLHADILEIVSRDEDEEIAYEVRVRGDVERVRTEDNVAGDDDDRIIERDDGTVLIRGSTGDQYGDAFRITGTVLSVRKTGGDSAYKVRLDGLQVDPDTLAPISGGAEPGDGAATRITSCTVIESSGAYVLARDVRNSRADACIEIRASNVTLDGDGHRVDGVDETGTVGVAVGARERGQPVSDVTVTDLGVSDWETGVRATGTQDGDATRVRLCDVWSASNLGHGVYFRDTTRSTIRDATVRTNGQTGVLFEESGTANALVNGDIAGNDGYGVLIFDGGVDLEVRQTRVRNNDQGGIGTSNGDRDTRLIENTIVANGGHGIGLSESAGTVVRENAVQDNDGSGISLTDVSRATVVGNDVHENDRYGVAVRYTSRSTIRENDVRRNGDSGVALVFSADNAVVDNVVCDNRADEQIAVDEDSSDNRVSDNRLTCS